MRSVNATIIQRIPTGVRSLKAGKLSVMTNGTVEHAITIQATNPFVGRLENGYPRPTAARMMSSPGVVSGDRIDNPNKSTGIPKKSLIVAK
jgi:hypothetical protein